MSSSDDYEDDNPWYNFIISTPLKDTVVQSDNSLAAFCNGDCDLEEGDIVKITMDPEGSGVENWTCAILISAQPTIPEDTLSVNGILARNIGIPEDSWKDGGGSKFDVRVQLFDGCEYGDEVTLEIQGGANANKKNFEEKAKGTITQYFHRAFRPCTNGDQYTFEGINMKVIDTKPDKSVVVAEDTKVIFTFAYTDEQKTNGKSKITSKLKNTTPRKFEKTFPVGDWDEVQVSGWLKTLQDGTKYATLFEENGVDGSLLLELDDPTLQEMGIRSLLTRRRLIKEINQLKDEDKRKVKKPVYVNKNIVRSGSSKKLEGLLGKRVFPPKIADVGKKKYGFGSPKVGTSTYQKGGFVSPKVGTSTYQKGGFGSPKVGTSTYQKGKFGSPKSTYQKGTFGAPKSTYQKGTFGAPKSTYQKGGFGSPPVEKKPYVNDFGVKKDGAPKLPGQRQVAQQHGPKHILPPVWQDGSKYKTCNSCTREKRGGRHNCRVCGLIFCTRCSDKMEVPLIFRNKKKSGKVRCCKPCKLKVSGGEWLLVEKKPVEKKKLIKLPKWQVRDKRATNCVLCDTPFSECKSDNCRACGSLVCEKCYVMRGDVPEKFRQNNILEGDVPVCTGCNYRLKKGHVFDEGGSESARQAVSITQIPRTKGNSKETLDVPRKVIAGAEQVYPPIWVGADSQTNCLGCGDKMGKGHHCRICGNLFCGDKNCSIKTEVPSRFKRKNKAGAVRVCVSCNNKVQLGTIQLINEVRKGMQVRGSISFNRQDYSLQGGKYMDYGGKNLGDDAVKKIALALGNDKSITGLNLSSNNVGSNAIFALSNQLRSNKRITTLDLSNNQINEGAFKVLCDAICQNSVLRSLHIQNNKLGDGSGKYLQKLFQKNSSLEYLDLGSNQLGKGVIKAAKSLETNRSLRTLIWKNNGIDDNGGKTIGKVVERNNSLFYIDLSMNPIGNSGGCAILKHLQNNVTLHHIVLDNREVPLKDIYAITRSNEREFVGRTLDIMQQILPKSTAIGILKYMYRKESIFPFQLFDLVDGAKA